MASADLDIDRPTVLDSPHPEAPITLDEPAAKTLGFFDQVGLWGNLGVSLLGFVGRVIKVFSPPHDKRR